MLRTTRTAELRVDFSNDALSVHSAPRTSFEETSRPPIRAQALRWRDTICPSSRPRGRYKDPTHMETFAHPRHFVDNPQFDRDREISLAGLARADIDPPIREVVAGFVSLPCCFTIQSCYGHFVHAERTHPDNLEPLPAHDVGSVKYRIAYIAICLQNNKAGRRLRAALEQIPAIDPDYVQFGSPDWFWERHLNSYALQVEPDRFANKDVAHIEHHEALRVQQVRDCFFDRLGNLVRALHHDQSTA